MTEASSFLKVQDADLLGEHLTNLLLRIVKEQPDDPLALFEPLSNSIKTPVVPAEPSAERLAEQLAAHQGTLDMIQPPKKQAAEGEEEEPEEEEEKEQAPIPDIATEMSLLEWAGFGLDAETTYKWTLSIQNLATAKALVGTRFWGVVNGTQKDYYVVEGKTEDEGEGEGEADEASRNEPQGQGANEFVYFVANTPGGPWTKLPPVKADHIQLACQMRRFLTGDLEAPVHGFPRFPAKESAYLRAQIARINAGAYVAPAGVFTVDPEDEAQEVTENEAYAGITDISAMLAGPLSWVHARTHLLKEGRTTPFVAADAEEEEEEEDGEAKPKEVVEKEVPPPKLRAVGSDEGEAWKYGTHSGGVVSVASLRWPGAVCVGQGKTYVNFYIGWGQKYEGKAFVPCRPPPMAEQWVGDEELLESDDVQPPADWVAPEEDEDDDAEDAAPAEAAAEE